MVKLKRKNPWRECSVCGRPIGWVRMPYGWQPVDADPVLFYPDPLGVPVVTLSGKHLRGVVIGRPEDAPAKSRARKGYQLHFDDGDKQ